MYSFYSIILSVHLKLKKKLSKVLKYVYLVMKVNQPYISKIYLRLK